MTRRHERTTAWSAVCLLVLLSACSVTRNIIVPATPFGNGISGMAQIDDTHYLIVHDEKSFQTGSRISVIKVASNQNIMVLPVRPSRWRHDDGRSNDLEGVCAIPGRDGEFLLIEAGHWAGDYGRMFHIEVDIAKMPYGLKVLHAYDLPEFNAKGPDDLVGDEIEGIECAQRRDGKTLVILGERGGSTAYATGVLRWVVLDLSAPAVPSFSAAGAAGEPVNAPGTWTNPAKNRDISALYLDDDGTLWAAATEETGESGTFRSVVFRVGSVDAEDSSPLQISRPFTVERTVDGFKVEALAAPTTQVAGSVFSIGTEDEVFGGAWRPLR